jgi:D-glycero-D-manno-heptose 1,7-bisphosphate phosphatase
LLPGIRTRLQVAKRAVFLDRDGVLIEDREVLTSPDQIRVLDGVPLALMKLKQHGFALVVVTNQAVVARGLVTEVELDEIHDSLSRLLQRAGAPPFDALYFCPHHPDATLVEYRVACECRKPRPGSLLRAAREHGLDPSASFFVGDRITDVIAGSRAGCRTVLLEGPQHKSPPIVTVEPLDLSIKPDHTCPDLPAAVEWILAR